MLEQINEPFNLLSFLQQWPAPNSVEKNLLQSMCLKKSAVSSLRNVGLLNYSSSFLGKINAVSLKVITSRAFQHNQL